MSENKNILRRIGVLVLCDDIDCSAMYTGMPENHTDTLPCGHKMATASFDGACFKSITMNKDDLEEMRQDISDIKNHLL